MIAYNKNWLDNLRIQNTADKWYRKGLIGQLQAESIKNQFTSGYKETNPFLRIGLALFTFIASVAAIGMILLVWGFGDSLWGTVFLGVAVISWILLELSVKDNKYFRHGIDDMLLYCSIFYFVVGLCVLNLMKYDLTTNDVLFISLGTFPILIIASIRFADSITSVLAYICMLLIIFLLVEKAGEIGKTIMPFVMLLVSFFVYRLVTGSKKNQRMHYWHHCLAAVEAVSLITLYASCNYFIVREASAEFFSLVLKPGDDIPLALIFYVLTLAIPAAYIVLGVRNKDRIRLRTGVILAALAVLTYRYYYHIISTEIALMVSGTMLVIFSWSVIQKLKTPWRGITFEDTEKDMAVAEAEGLLIAQTFGQQVVKSNEVGGGGQFGGGGASGKF